jgi:Na+-driven multidrug efflux pump
VLKRMHQSLICSTRVSNELGAGNPQAAKVAVKAIMVLAIAEMVTVSMILYFCRNVLGYAFSKEKEIVDHVADMGPWICLSIIMDGLQAVLSGNFLLEYMVRIEIFIINEDRITLNKRIRLG